MVIARCLDVYNSWPHPSHFLPPHHHVPYHLVTPSPYFSSITPPSCLAGDGGGGELSTGGSSAGGGGATAHHCHQPGGTTLPQCQLCEPSDVNLLGGLAGDEGSSVSHTACIPARSYASVPALLLVPALSQPPARPPPPC